MSGLRDKVDVFLNGGTNSSIRNNAFQPLPSSTGLSQSQNCLTPPLTPSSINSARGRNNKDINFIYSRNDSSSGYIGSGSSAVMAEVNVTHPPYASQE